jgi:hypothetical protein
MFILGAVLIVIYGFAMPIRNLLISLRQRDAPFNEGRAAADGERFTQWRRKIGLVGAALCMVASLILALVSLAPTV